MRKKLTSEEMLAEIHAIRVQGEEDRKRSDEERKRAEEERKRSHAELKKLNKMLGDQMRSYGALVEGLVGDSVGKLLANRTTGKFQSLIENFPITTLENAPDIDCVLLFEKAVIAVDIKSNYNKTSYLKRFTEDLLPAFVSDPNGSRLIGNRLVFGAVAALKYSTNVLASAQKLKLFTIRLINDNASIENKKSFQPKDWSSP